MWLKEISDLIYPPIQLCPICQLRPIKHTLPGCLQCLLPLNLQVRKLRTAQPAYALTDYGERIKELLNMIKYQNDYQLALAFGKVMGLALKEEAIMQKVDYLLPIPLHVSRLKKRSYNQALALAQGITQVWSRPIFNDLIRVKDTLPQSRLNPTQRRKNLKQAFMISQPELVRAKCFLIIDDIFTTGATFYAVGNLVSKHQGEPMGFFLTQSSTDR